MVLRFCSSIMATADVIHLSSSPARPRRLHVATMSSSPNLPSPRALTRRQQLRRTGLSATPIARNASPRQSVTEQEKPIDTVRDLVAPVNTLGEDKIAKLLKPKAMRRPRAIKAHKDCDPATAKKPRQPRAKKVNEAAVNSAELKEKRTSEGELARKPRAENLVSEGHTTLPKGRVTNKSTAKNKVSGKVTVARKRKTEKVSSHFTSAVGQSAQLVKIPVDETFQLIAAGKRKSTWTPPKDTNNRLSITASEVNGILGKNNQINLEDTQKGFPDLIGRWGYNNEAEASTSARVVDACGIRKRKLIELVVTNAHTPGEPEPEPEPKPRAVRKKPKTITDLATSAYRTAGEEKENPTGPAPLLKYVSRLNGEAVAVEMRTLDGFKMPAKPRTRSPVKPSTKPSKSKRAELPKLFSPQSALKLVEKQDFVFGTSSQLAREDSPTLLRDLHQAMLESNKVASDTFYDLFDTPITERSTACFIDGKGAVLYPGKRNLWSAGAYGGTMDIETLDMTGTPKTDKTKIPQLPFLSNPETLPKSIARPRAEKDEWLCLNDTPVVPMRAVDVPLANNDSNKIITETSLPKSPSSSNMLSPRSRLPPSNNASSASKPDFESYTTAQLTREVASYRFKPIKNRNTMIALLEKCWEGKRGLALGTLGVNRAMSMSPVKPQTSKDGEISKTIVLPKKSRPRKDIVAAVSPKRSVGRPKKDSVAPQLPKHSAGHASKDNTLEPSLAKSRTPRKATATLDDTCILSDSDIPLSAHRVSKKPAGTVLDFAVDEISDREGPLTPSPPRRRASKVGTPPKRLEIECDESIILSPTSRQLELHKFITKAIMSSPPSIDPKSPSWHEKILLYDPIVLEDLTAWLNTGALQKVGWDGEVEPKEVKTWCLGKSICCLWRENLRGGARSRY